MLKEIESNKNKIILDLCGGTGSWSAPYKAAGYDVRVITLPDYDVNTYVPPKSVYGILAAPPCTDFSIAGTQYWKRKDVSGQTEKSLAVVYACMRIIEKSRPVFWALENPIGRLQKFLGNPVVKLNYMDFGCIYSKYVQLWGKFKIPIGLCYTTQSISSFDRCDNYFSEPPSGYDYKAAGMTKRAARRSITFVGFANAFFKFNQ